MRSEAGMVRERAVSRPGELGAWALGRSGFTSNTLMRAQKPIQKRSERPGGSGTPLASFCCSLTYSRVYAVSLSQSLVRAREFRLKALQGLERR